MNCFSFSFFPSFFFLIFCAVVCFLLRCGQRLIHRMMGALLAQIDAKEIISQKIDLLLTTANHKCVPSPFFPPLCTLRFAPFPLCSRLSSAPDIHRDASSVVVHAPICDRVVPLEMAEARWSGRAWLRVWVWRRAATSTWCCPSSPSSSTVCLACLFLERLFWSIGVLSFPPHSSFLLFALVCSFVVGCCILRCTFLARIALLV